MNFLRRFAGKSEGGPVDVERNIRPVGSMSAESRMDAPPSKLGLTANDRLETFRLLSGISTQAPLSSGSKRAAPNLGIYKRVVTSEQNAKRNFKVFSFLISACLGLQIVVAAALTAMGAANTSHGAITVFGAINTVIAGFLTYLKGSGLPGRLKYYQNEWKKVREYIEQRERDFSRPECTLDPYKIVETVEIMYDIVKADIEANTPEGFSSRTGIKQNGLHAPGTQAAILSTTQEISNSQRIQELDEEKELAKKYLSSTIGEKTDEISESAENAQNVAKETTVKYFGD